MKIIPGAKYIDKNDLVWEVKFSEKNQELMLWRKESGFGLWNNGIGVRFLGIERSKQIHE